MIEIREYTNAELTAIPPIVIDPGVTDEHGITRGRHLRNPFAGVDAGLAHRWSNLHWAGDSNDATVVASDPFSDLRAALTPQTMWHEARNAEGQLVAAHPVEWRNITAWEADCAAMIENQKTITLAAKPVAKTGQPTRIVSDLDGKRESIPKFEDSAESIRMLGLQRGD